MLKQRAALAIATVLSLVAFVSCDSTDENRADTSSPTAAAPTDWKPVSGMDLTEPQQLQSENGVLEVTLTMHEKTIEVSGSPIETRPYNDSLIGPTLSLSPGEKLVVTIENEIDQMTNIHYHGLHVSPSGISDNVYRMIPGGATVESVVELPDDHEPGTFWYHVHHHGNTATQLQGGMSGLLIVEGLEDRLPAELQSVTQRQIALRDVQAKGGKSVISSAKYDVTKPSARLVNGLLKPKISIAPGETQLWRIANIGSSFFYDVQLDGHTMYVIAQDAAPVWEVWEAKHLVLSPGQRFDVLVQGGDAGTYALRTLKYDQGFQRLPNVELATVEVAGDEQTPAALPVSLEDRASQDLTDAKIARHRTFRFTIQDKPLEFLINKKAFSVNRLDAKPKLGTVEEWTLINDSDEEHPFHIHVNDFQVMRVNGKPYNAHGLQDVVVLPVGGSVEIRNPYNDFTGKYVFHCHILFHEDNGMMAGVKVVR